MPKLEFTCNNAPLTADIRDLVVAGWTGRDSAAVEHHIAELAAIGVARPRTVPCFYRCGANLLTSAHALDVTGNDSSGEVEFMLLSLPEGLFVGVGSDHTDRKVEAYGVTVSKQMCPKPIGPELWRFDEVHNHWDSLILRSYATRNGSRELYQQGPVTKMLAPTDLVARYTKFIGASDAVLPLDTAMYCGTLPVLTTIGPSDTFEIELEDPIRKRTLRHSYSTRSLPYND